MKTTTTKKKFKSYTVEKGKKVTANMVTISKGDLHEIVSDYYDNTLGKEWWKDFSLDEQQGKEILESIDDTDLEFRIADEAEREELDEDDDQAISFGVTEYIDRDLDLKNFNIVNTDSEK